jgi:hypothetical protein
MLPDGRIECRLCPRFCKLNEGQRGFCFVRQRVGDRMVLTTYGRSSGFCIDPIEKKPLNHFLPDTSVLSFGTAGCTIRKRKRHKSKISPLSRSRVARLFSMANCFGPTIARKTRSFHSLCRRDRYSFHSMHCDLRRARIAGNRSGRNGVRHFQEWEAVKTCIASVDFADSVLAHQHGCVDIVQGVPGEVRDFRNHLY